MTSLSPVKAIRAKCLDCSAWQATEVRLCVMHDCPLYPYRMGKNPNLKGKRGKGDPKALQRARAEKSRGDGTKTGGNRQQGGDP